MNKARKPNLFIVGHPRTGTTALYQFLKQHPDVFTIEEKEPNYFAQEYNKNRFKDSKLLDHFTCSLEEYLFLYKDVEDEKYILDATPYYLFSKKAAERIHTFNPEAKIIMIFREPCDFLRSWHSKLVYDFKEEEKSFKQALYREVDRKAKSEFAFLYYSEWTKYVEQLNRYQNLYGKKQINVVIYELFKKNNKGTFDNILDFLHIEKDVRITFGVHNPNIVLKYGFIKRFMEKSYIWINMKRAKRVMPGFLFDFILNLYTRLTWKKKPREEYSRKEQGSIKMNFYKNVEDFDSFLRKEEYVKDSFSLLDYWRYGNLQEKT